MPDTHSFLFFHSPNFTLKNYLSSHHSHLTATLDQLYSTAITIMPGRQRAKRPISSKNSRGRPQKRTVAGAKYNDATAVLDDKKSPLYKENANIKACLALGPLVLLTHISSGLFDS
jgi:hypothetical protein